MAYDPQRQHQRHQVSPEEGPAPVDVLLEPSEVEHPHSGRRLVGIALVVVVVLALLAACRAHCRHRSDASSD